MKKKLFVLIGLIAIILVTGSILFLVKTKEEWKLIDKPTEGIAIYLNKKRISYPKEGTVARVWVRVYYSGESERKAQEAFLKQEAEKFRIQHEFNKLKPFRSDEDWHYSLYIVDRYFRYKGCKDYLEHGEKLSYMQILMEFNCFSQKFKILRTEYYFTGYYPDTGDMHRCVIDEEEVPEPVPEPGVEFYIIPVEGPEAKIAKYACKKYWVK